MITIFNNKHYSINVYPFSKYIEPFYYNIHYFNTKYKVIVIKFSFN